MGKNMNEGNKSYCYSLLIWIYVSSFNIFTLYIDNVNLYFAIFNE